MGMIHSQVTSHLIWPEFIASEPEEILFPKVSCFASVHALPSISSTALKQPGFLLTWLRPVLCRVPHSQFPSTHSYYSLADHSVTFRMLFPTFSPQFSGKNKKAFHGKSPPFKRFCHRNTTNIGTFSWKKRIIILQVCCNNVSSSCALLPLLLKWSRPNMQETARKKEIKVNWKLFYRFLCVLSTTSLLPLDFSTTSIQSPFLKHHPPIGTFWDVLPQISRLQIVHIMLGATMAQELSGLRSVWQFLCTRILLRFSFPPQISQRRGKWMRKHHPVVNWDHEDLGMGPSSSSTSWL